MALNVESILKYSRQYIELFYLHKMTIYRNVEVEKPNGTIANELRAVDGMVDIPCRISFNKLNVDNPLKTTDTTNPIQEKPKIFCSPDLNIIAGDIVHITVSNKVYKGTASDVSMYADNHIEFTLGIDVEA